MEFSFHTWTLDSQPMGKLRVLGKTELAVIPPLVYNVEVT